jgi:hypothetical protein
MESASDDDRYQSAAVTTQWTACIVEANNGIFPTHSGAEIEASEGELEEGLAAISIREALATLARATAAVTSP